MPSTSAPATTTTLRDIFIRHGLPEQLVTDNGPQFTSQAFKEFLQQHGIQHILTPPYHPKSNGQAENFVRTLKNAPRRGGTGKEAIQSFLLQYPITPHVTTGKSPCMLLVGRQLRSVLDLSVSLDLDNQPTRLGLEPGMAGARSKQNYYSDRNSRQGSFTVGDSLLVAGALDKHHWIKGNVVRRIGKVVYEVRSPDNRLCRAHADHMKIRVATVPSRANVLLPWPEAVTTATPEQVQK
ncbi:uncharacterized protein K02A2.6-like [Ornithodoros turicata]|uniref:uncharacterized protein K02A2.6-like n=1 Tax=Ornithodoros turicata TaxID=34597 RepID=UPI00313918C3